MKQATKLVITITVEKDEAGTSHISSTASFSKKEGKTLIETDVEGVCHVNKAHLLEYVQARLTKGHV